MSLLKKLLFSLLLVLSPTQLAFHFWPSWSLVNGTRVDYLSPALYATDILIVLLILLHVNELHFPRKYLLVFICLACVNIFFSLSPETSVYRFIKLGEFSLLALLLFRTSEKLQSVAQRMLPLALIWTCLLSLLQWFNHGSLNGLWYWLGERSFTTQTPGIALSKLFGNVSLRPYATLPHPNALASFLILGWILWMKLSPVKSNFFWRVTILLGIVVLLTESYTSWIALVAVGVFFQAQTRLSFLKKNLWQMLVICVFIISVLAPFFFSSLRLVSVLPQNIRERIELSYLAGFAASRNPLFGVGLGTFIKTIPLYSDLLPNVYHVRTTQLLQPIHNIPLLLMAETGVVGLITLFTILFLATPSAPLVFFLISGFFDHYWLTLQSPMLLFAIALGFQAFRAKSSKSTK